MFSERKTSFSGVGLLVVWMWCGGCSKPATPPLPASTSPPVSTTPAAVGTPAAIVADTAQSMPLAVPAADKAPAPETATGPAPSLPATASQTPEVSGVSVGATAEWYVPYVFTLGNAPPPPPPLPTLEVRLAARGGPAPDFVSAGNLRIDRAEAGPRRVQLDLSEYRERMAELPPLDRASPGHGQPNDGVDLTVRFVYPGEPIQQMTRLAGQFDGVTAGHVQEYSGIKYPDLLKLADNDPLLKSLGLKVKTDTSEFLEGRRFLLNLGPQAVLAGLKFSDGEGNARYDSWSTDYSSNGDSQLTSSTVSLEEEATTLIRFLVYSDLKRVTVPFDIADIQVAPPKAMPPAEQAQTVVYAPSDTNPSLPDGLRIDCRFDWLARPAGLFEGPAEKTPTARVELSGPLARQVEDVQSLTVTKAISDSGALQLAHQPQIGSFVTHKPLMNIGGAMYTALGKPIECPLRFALPEQPLRQCQELSGEIVLHVVEERDLLDFGGVLESPAGTLQHPALEKLGLAITYQSRREESVAESTFLDFTVTTENWLNCGGWTYLTNNGGIELPVNVHKENNTRVYSFLVSDKQAPSTRLKLEIFPKARLLAVPFHFTNLPIPAPPAE